MTEDRDKLLINLDVRVKQVLLLCDQLKHENSLLRGELISKDEKIAGVKQEISVMKQKYDNLKTARTITAASVDVDTAKKKLSRLVREVDKCIGLLTK